MNLLQLGMVAGSALILAGCMNTGSHGFSDIDEYMAQVKSRQSGRAEPLPEFRPYESFTYRASALRSPFKEPVKFELTQEQKNKNVKPDMYRTKQHLESFSMDSFRLVGSISNVEGFWGLVHAEDGIHRVKIGDYMGRDHGRITYIDDDELHLTEIVPVGPKYWIERPRILRISSK